MNSQVIVCTRNRPADVTRVLASFLDQEYRPPLLFVDSSDGAETEALVAEAHLADPSIAYLHADPGLTRQRMRGVREISSDTEVVHFLDDDVVLEPGYFAGIERVFEERADAIGVGGLITNFGDHNPWWWRRVFLLEAREGGRVLRSGVNTLVLHATEELPVQWLSGCAMSYRYRIFDEIEFDTRMQGYSIGEDVEFSYRAGFAGTLWVTPQARLQHLESPVEREALYRLARAEAVARHRRVAEMAGHGVSLPAFWWSMAGAVTLNVSRGVLKLSRFSLRRAVSLLKACADIVRDGPIARDARLPRSG